MSLMLDHSLEALRAAVAACFENAIWLDAKGYEGLAETARWNADKLTAVIAAREAFAARSEHSAR